jgi:hypothetical protein
VLLNIPKDTQLFGCVGHPVSSTLYGQALRVKISKNALDENILICPKLKHGVMQIGGVTHGSD